MSLGVHITGEIIGQKIHLDTILFSWGIMAFLLLSTFLMTRGLKVEGGGGCQTVLETLWGTINELTSAQIPKDKSRNYIPLIGGMFVFILFAYWLGLMPWKAGEGLSFWPMLDDGHAWEGSSPAADINVTAGMAFIAVFTYVTAGIKAGGMHYISMYFKPLGFVEWLDLFVRPLTLALRLFANTLAGEILLTSVLGLIALFIPILALAFELFVGIIQALVFSLLTSVYIGTAYAHCAHENEHH